MKTTSDYHGYQIKIHASGTTADFLYKKGKVWNTRKAASNALGKLTCELDDGKVVMPEFNYGEVIEYFA